MRPLAARGVLAVLVGLGPAPLVSAQPDQKGQSYFVVLGDYLAEPDGEHQPELDASYGLDVRYGETSDTNWAYEWRIFYGPLNPKAAEAAKAFRGGAGVDALYRFSGLWGITPIALGGGGLAYSDSGSGNVREPQGGFFLDVGAGILTPPFLDLLGWSFRGRAEIREAYEHYKDSYLDLHGYLGVEMTAVRPPPDAEPVQVVAVEPTAPAPEPEPVTPPPPASEQATQVTTVKEVLTLKGVTFEFNSDALKPESFPVLDEVAAILNAEHPEVRVQVAGHTDSSGDEVYNLDLSRRRAITVRDYLVGQGVEAARLTAEGYGEREPVADNATREGRSQNRRVELRIMSE